jgi:hypothetical protein
MWAIEDCFDVVAMTLLTTFPGMTRQTPRHATVMQAPNVSSIHLVQSLPTKAARLQSANPPVTNEGSLDAIAPIAHRVSAPQTPAAAGTSHASDSRPMASSAQSDATATGTASTGYSAYAPGSPAAAGRHHEGVPERPARRNSKKWSSKKKGQARGTSKRDKGSAHLFA